MIAHSEQLMARAHAPTRVRTRWAAETLVSFVLDALLHWIEDGDPDRDGEFLARVDASLPALVAAWASVGARPRGSVEREVAGHLGVRRVEVHLGFGRRAESPWLHRISTYPRTGISPPSARRRTMASQPTIGWPPARGSIENLRSSKCWRQSHGVAMRSRMKPFADAPSTKYGALPMRSSRHSIASPFVADRARASGAPTAAATCSTSAA